MHIIYCTSVHKRELRRHYISGCSFVENMSLWHLTVKWNYRIKKQYNNILFLSNLLKRKTYGLHWNWVCTKCTYWCLYLLLHVLNIRVYKVLWQNIDLLYTCIYKCADNSCMLKCITKYLYICITWQFTNIWTLDIMYFGTLTYKNVHIVIYHIGTIIYCTLHIDICMPMGKLTFTNLKWIW